ncbi:class I SAM-dependent RNA methyltransferase [Mesobacterium sp. TK19101]|uniref:Class I SAM-dependent RNA methyltransferase n=1 Tax=Mesobacterium hydrothermale TaxID=3111907 RepID=A0ABU6HGT4_9RHOB|nr:class I SAM-dependent RNA methyltransferase [Mesobacterium sp. TK19101]MEC3860678.1 class I SAM-dependent RNA methyltransferase [Mesobacterium sp. TK19101]
MTTYRIDRLGHQGDGIAQGPIYAPGCLPGEEVTGTLDGQVLRDIRIITPSDDRVKPPCPHAKSCGGCQLQHASDDFVAAWKRQVVETALRAQGIDATVTGPLTSPARSRRRAAISARRTKKGALAGFHMKGSDVVVSVPNCQLVHPNLAAALPMVEALAILGASRKGELSVLVTLSEAGLDVDVSGGKPLESALQSQLAELAREYDLARVGWDGETALTRRPAIRHFGPVAITPPSRAFLQATAEGEAALRDAVMDLTEGAKHVVDLFAGCGTFALPLSTRARVHAVEGDAAMVRALDQAWRMGDGLRHVTHAARDLYRNPLLPDELNRFDAAVIDPPRAGADSQIAALADSKVPVIAYVSCNPVTFARDAACLIRAGFDIGTVTVVDQFRWSTHVELIAGFSRSF